MKPEHVHFRLSHEAWVRYSSQAQAHEMALGSYVRLRLEQQDEFLAGELAKLKLAAQPLRLLPDPTMNPCPAPSWRCSCSSACSLAPRSPGLRTRRSSGEG